MHVAIKAPCRWCESPTAPQKRAARTLSRNFWQPKNFHAHRHRVSSALAKTGFTDESRQPIRKPILHHDGRSRSIADVATRACAHRTTSRDGARGDVARRSDAEFRLQEIVDRLRVG